MPASTLTKRSVALWRAIRVETGFAVCLIDCGISMHLATKILLRDLRSVLARKSPFFGTFPTRNVKVSSTLSLNSYRLALLVRSEYCDLCKEGAGTSGTI